MIQKLRLLLIRLLFGKAFGDKIVLEDAKAYMTYRNEQYKLNETWPTEKKAQKKYARSLFNFNLNGFRDMVYYRIGGV